MTNEKIVTEKTLLQRRIKNQRKQLRLLGRQLDYQRALVARYRAENVNKMRLNFRQAAIIVSDHWLASSAARTLRQW